MKKRNYLLLLLVLLPSAAALGLLMPARECWNDARRPMRGGGVRDWASRRGPEDDGVGYLLAGRIFSAR
jgi:hypothetical protein